MSKCKLLLSCLIGMLLSAAAFADMPYITNNIAESRERVQNGDMSCETSHPQATVNAGVYGNNGQQYRYQDDDKGAFIAISIPIGGNQNKVDCQPMYDQMLQQKDLQLKQLQAQNEMLMKNLQLQSDRSLTAK
ncbi:hypothetical protein PP187_gp040 [Klebsiella phage vB_KvM-Eowyn]|uniref:Uncharacterized protein n=1 Tax=Klebsiella phage vB_KvM-Eowyn TaxID=2762819 RepID=A0A7R8R6C1_9CAUD|nr:hypothetical protein PP187_gp040 [Klebsiella phage vB_KvM-Eowyn]CAD5236029.1 hypothetical protein LLCLJKAH_00040 [Klebsiella phage vB_KvM-Eowyn]